MERSTHTRGRFPVVPVSGRHQPGAAGSGVVVLVPEHALGRALDGVASVLELVLGVGLALLGLPLGLGLLVVGDLAEALLRLAAQLVLRVLELLVSTHRQPPGSSLRTGPVRYGESRTAAREAADLPVGATRRSAHPVAQPGPRRPARPRRTPPAPHICCAVSGIRPPARTMSTWRSERRCVSRTSRPPIVALSVRPSRSAACTPSSTTSSPFRIASRSAGSANSSGTIPKFARFCQWIRAKLTAITICRPRWRGAITACSREEPWP